MTRKRRLTEELTSTLRPRSAGKRCVSSRVHASINSVGRSDDPLVSPSVGRSLTLYFLSPKGDLTSVTAPAQRTRLMLSCIRPCLLLRSFLDMRLYDCSFRTLLVIPCKHAWILIVYTRLYKSFRPSVGPSVGLSCFTFFSRKVI